MRAKRVPQTILPHNGMWREGGAGGGTGTGPSYRFTLRMTLHMSQVVEACTASACVQCTPTREAQNLQS